MEIAVESHAIPYRSPAWEAVFALTLCVATLIASEFMPVSLLTPIATDLHMTEGHVGQAIAISGIFAVLTSLVISSATRGIDRRIVLLSLTLLMMASGLVVAFAPNSSVFMVGRALIGIVIGGFWSMSAATVMRLVPEAQVPHALGLLNGGNALATTIAAPVGSFLGQYIGWRGAFFSMVPLAALTLAWLFASLPSMPSERGPRGGGVFRVLRLRQVTFGMAAVTLFFMGQFTLYTYLRPFLETVARVDVSTLSLILLIIGGGGLLGTYLIGIVLRTQLYSVLIATPLAMAAIAVALTAYGSSPITVAILLAGWGLIGTAAPVGWWTWLSKVLPDEAEAGGGLMVAVIQLAIAFGATVGGFFYDMSGYRSTFAVSAAVLCASALLAMVGWRQGCTPGALGAARLLGRGAFGGRIVRDDDLACGQVRRIAVRGRDGRAKQGGGDVRPTGAGLACALGKLLMILRAAATGRGRGKSKAWLPVSAHSRHHEMTLPSRKNFPVRSCGASSANHTAVAAPSTTSRSAFGPPMSVLTQPGQTELTATASRSSAASIVVTAFSAAFEMR